MWVFFLIEKLGYYYFSSLLACFFFFLCVMFTDSVHLNWIQDRIRRNADKKSQIFFLVNGLKIHLILMLILSLLICYGLQDIKYLVLLPKQWRHFQNYELSEKKSEILQTKCLRGEGIFFFTSHMQQENLSIWNLHNLTEEFQMKHVKRNVNVLFYSCQIASIHWMCDFGLLHYPTFISEKW